MSVSRATVTVLSAACVLAAFALAAFAQPDAKQLYDKALVMGIAGDWDSAQNSLIHASRVAPDNVSIAIISSIASDCARGRISPSVGQTLFRSVAAGNSGNWQEALDLAQEACRLAPDYSLGRVHMGTVLATMCSRGEGVVRADVVIEAYEIALQLDPTSGLAHYNLAVAYAASGTWPKARHHLRLAKTQGINIPGEVSSQVEKHLGPTSFFRGIIGPLAFIVNAPRILLSPTPQGSSLVDALLTGTWGSGGGWYRVGFIVGVLVLFNIPPLVRAVRRR